jgi:curved DNA-binding protein CbpA
MSNSSAQKDYYEILGAHEGATARELERLYKRRAAQSHPDRGGSEEEMKSLNEAYGVLRNQETRKTYDAQRAKPGARFVPVTAPTAQDVGLLGRGLSSFLCLIIGLFLLVLVRSQWIFFLWPMAILAFLVILLGVVMARGTMHAFNSSLPATNPFRRYTRIQEAAFWCVVAACCYGVYLLMTSL